MARDTIINVKPPNTLYIFTIPIVKYLLLKDSRTMAVLFLSKNIRACTFLVLRVAYTLSLSLHLAATLFAPARVCMPLAALKIVYISENKQI